MPKVVKLEDIERLSRLQCTEPEIYGFLGLTHKQWVEIKRDPDVQAALTIGQNYGKISIRRKQFRLADESAPMAIHLGKQYLGQKDVQRTELTGAEGGPIETIDLSKLSIEEKQDLRRLLARSSNT